MDSPLNPQNKKQRGVNSNRDNVDDRQAALFRFLGSERKTNRRTEVILGGPLKNDTPISLNGCQMLHALFSDHILAMGAVARCSTRARLPCSRARVWDSCGKGREP